MDGSRRPTYRKAYLITCISLSCEQNQYWFAWRKVWWNSGMEITFEYPIITP